MKIYLIRHGESISNRDMIIQGHHDAKLSEKGCKQAKWLHQYLPEFDRVYSSPLTRAVETAIISTLTTRQDIIIRRNLMEISFGDFEGRNGFDIEGFDINSFRLFSRIVKDTYEGEYNVETHTDFHLRVHTEFERIVNEIQKLSLSKVAIFSHGGVIRSLMQFYFKFETQETAYFKNTEIVILTNLEENWSYKRKTSHLK